MVNAQSRIFLYASAAIMFIFLGLCIGVLMTHVSPSVYYTYTLHKSNAMRVVLDGWTSSVVLFYAINYCFIALFGLIILWPLFLKLKHELFLVKLIAGFSFGYVCSIPIIRFLTVFFQASDVFIPVWVMIAMCSIGLIMFYYSKGLMDKNSWQVIAPKKIPLEIIYLAISGFILYAILMLQVSQADFSWVGHGIKQYSHLLKEWATRDYFPIVTYHYDEFIFHHFLEQGVDAKFNSILPWWLTLGFIKVSTCSLLYLIFRWFGVSTVLAWVYSLFMCVGTLSLLPDKYYMLFDSSNPIVFTAHAGRIVGITIFLVLLMDLIARLKSQEHLSWLAVVLICLGLTSTAFSNVVVIVVLVMIAIYAINFFKQKSNLCGQSKDDISTRLSNDEEVLSE